MHPFNGRIPFDRARRAWLAANIVHRRFATADGVNPVTRLLNHGGGNLPLIGSIINDKNGFTVAQV